MRFQFLQRSGPRDSEPLKTAVVLKRQAVTVVDEDTLTAKDLFNFALQTASGLVSVCAVEPQI